MKCMEEPNMKKLKSPFFFALSMMPLMTVAGLISFFYQYGIMKETLDQAAAQLGGLPILILGGLLQTLIIFFIACFFGWILSRKLGLSMELRFEKKPVILSLGLAFLVAVFLLADCLTTGRICPAIVEANRAGQNLLGIAAGIIYGGIAEELLMRLFLMNLLAFLMWKLFAKKASAAPRWVLVTANILAAVLFAAGHLPATVGIFGGLTPILILRCFFLNGIGGIFFGWLYQHHGLSYAMLSHMFSHIFFKILFALFF